MSTRLYRIESFQVPGAHESPRLRFWHWFSMSTDDYGYVQIQVEGGSWQQLSGTYTSVSSGVWTRPSLELTAYAGQRIQVAFYFYSHNYGGGGEDVSSGWYVDDIELVTGTP
ncbi:MAG: hypothetical protein FJY88_11525, partial [Candidatus Eisenbacteria bacterium]|nr:hypothetical protein [Candidatus Eisenbacteria bacterium]